MTIVTSLCRVSAIVLFFAVSATASVINFNTLTGANGDLFSTYSENGFIGTATQGSWSKAFNFGNQSQISFATTVRRNCCYYDERFPF
jgi:hypothetical protein